jgi:ATP diphosphatase
MTAETRDRRAIAIHRLLDLMARLRDPADGCPWDREQTFRTIAPYTIEEAYEVADAIERENRQDLREELGDLLFQVVFHARMAEEEGAFDFVDVADGLTDKMIRRHPHVFRRDEVGAEVRWEETKDAERARKAGAGAGVLDGVAAGLPALMRAEKLQKRAARVGFDWPEARQVLAKIREEIDEVEVEIDAADSAAIEGEIGDLLFAVVNLARHVGVDSEAALRGCNGKFERRFGHIERALAAQGRGPKEATLDEMEALWVAAKDAERRR